MPAGAGLPRLAFRRPGLATVLLSTVALIIAIVAIRLALVQLFASMGPAAPVGKGSSPALAVTAMVRASSARTAGEAEYALDIARQALAADPLSARAFVGAAFAYQKLGQRDRALEAMETALGRDPRNRAARQWMIERSLTAGRNRAALRHLDAFLRQEPRLAPEMSRAMVPLLAARDMVDPFADLMAGNPAWVPPFLDNARREPLVAPRVTALMLELADRPGVRVPRDSVSAVVISALSRGDLSAARRIYGAYFPEAARVGVALYNGALSDLAAPAPFNWTFPENGGVGATFQREGQNEGIELRPLGGNSADVAEQALTLAAGRYLLASEVGSATLGGDAVASWRLLCLRDGRELGTVVLPSEGNGQSRVTGMLSIPPECPAQRLVLHLEQSSRSEGAILIDNVSLERSGAYVAGPQ